MRLPIKLAVGLQESPMADHGHQQNQEHGHHCPFLNRADERCSAHFQLDHLGEAFEHCFDEYAACPIYLELLSERRFRRSLAAAGVSSSVWGAKGSRHVPPS